MRTQLSKPAGPLCCTIHPHRQNDGTKSLQRHLYLLAQEGEASLLLLGTRRFVISIQVECDRLDALLLWGRNLNFRFEFFALFPFKYPFVNFTTHLIILGFDDRYAIHITNSTRYWKRVHRLDDLLYVVCISRGYVFCIYVREFSHPFCKVGIIPLLKAAGSLGGISNLLQEASCLKLNQL